MSVRNANAHSKGRRRAAAWGPPVVAVLCALALWELVVRAGLLSQTSFPPMTETVAELARQLGTGDFWSAVANTLQGWALGLGLAILLPIVLAPTRPWMLIVLLLIPASLMPSWLMIAGRRRKSLVPVLKQTGLINLGYAVLFSLGLVLRF